MQGEDNPFPGRGVGFGLLNKKIRFFEIVQGVDFFGDAQPFCAFGVGPQ